MEQILIETVNHETIEDHFIISTHKTTTIEEIFNKYIQRLVEQDLTEKPKFQQVAVCYRNDPQKRLPGNIKYQDIPANSPELIVILPKSSRPIIECRFANSHYLIYSYNKNDKLDRVLSSKKDLKAIVQQKMIKKMSINNKNVDFDQEMYTPIMQYIEGRVNSIVEIVIQIEEGNQKIRIPPSNQKILPKPINEAPAKMNPKEEQPEIKPAKVQPNQSNKEQPQQKKPISQVNKQLQLKLSFERVTGQGGKIEITETVDRNKTLQQLLPDLIMSLKKSDYDWPYPDYEHKRDKDKITIFLIIPNSTQNKIQLNKPLRNYAAKQPSISLAINRHYEGG